MRRAWLVLMLLGLACKPTVDSNSPSDHEAHHGHDAVHHGHGPAEHGADGHEGHSPAEGHVHHGGHHRFDDAEQWAKVFDDPERDAWQKPDEVVKWMKLAPDATVADIGAGTGYFAMRFAKAVPGGSVVGNDIEASMVEHMQNRAKNEGIENFAAVQGTAERPSLGRKVDVAFLCDVTHHINDRVAYFRALADELETGGKVVIVDFKKDAPADAPGPPAQMRIQSQDLVSELERAGYRLVREERELLEHQYLLEFEKAD